MLAFIPLFVSMDPIGVVPFYLSITGGLDRAHRRTVLLEAMATAFLVGAGFIFLGQAVFNYLDITTSDFRVAGGVILLVLAISTSSSPANPARSRARTSAWCRSECR